MVTAPLPPHASSRLVAFEVRHFRIFERERLDVHPSVTVLVGSNDTGKSTLLEAIRLYGIIVQRAGFRGPLSDEQFSGTGEQATRFVAEWETGDGNVWTHTLTLDAQAPEERLSCGDRFWAWNPKKRRLETDKGVFEANEVERYASLAQIDEKRWQVDTNIPAEVYSPLATARSFRTAEAYLFEPSALAQPAPISRATPDRNGYAWANWLQDIINRRNDDIIALERDVRALFPFFRSVTVKEKRIKIQSEERELGSGKLGEPTEIEQKRTRSGRVIGDVIIASDLRSMLDRLSDLESTREVLIDVAGASKEGSVQVSASQVSSGLLLALSHFALLHASSKGDLLLLEEPENGLNGEITLQMIRTFLDVVKKREQQLILTTHHPFWLDLVEPSSIRLLTRDERGAHVQDVAKEIDAARENDVYASEIMSTYGPKGLLYVKDRSGQ